MFAVLGIILGGIHAAGTVYRGLRRRLERLASLF